MNIEFLRRLFTSCSEETGNGYRDGLNLSELYYRIEEVAEVERQFSEVRSGAGLSPSVEDSISAAAYAVIRAYEMQGFINGFRLCAQLGKELSGMERNTNESDKYMAVIQRIAGLASLSPWQWQSPRSSRDGLCLRSKNHLLSIKRKTARQSIPRLGILCRAVF